MPSPTDNFVGLPMAQLLAIKQQFLERAVMGNVVSIGGGSKNQSKQFDYDTKQGLQDVNFAIDLANGKSTSRKVVDLLTGQRNQPFPETIL